MLYGLLSLTGVSFNPSTDIPSLAGKVILVTGGNGGLGKETILQLSKHNPAHIYLSARNESKALAAIADIESTFTDTKPPPITFIQCDLSSLPSVQKAARGFVSKEQRLDILFLNAGVMGVPPATTEEGYEIQFGTNHMGHALLTKLLLPTLLKTAEKTDADVRVVCLSSLAHLVAPAIDFDRLRTPMDSFTTTPIVRYGQSKLANLLFTKELSRRYHDKGITAVSVHPGIVNTELYRATMDWPVVGSLIGAVKNVFYTSVQGGAKGQLWAATAEKGAGKGMVKSGDYYTPVGVPGNESARAMDGELAEKLWVWTEKELEGYTL